MAVVSIAEASKLTGKSRTTLYKYIQEGKLSKCTDEQDGDKVDTSELIRVFGRLKKVESGQKTEHIGQRVGQDLTTDSVQLNRNEQAIEQIKHQAELDLLRQKVEFLEQLLSEKDKRLLLLEHKVIGDENTIQAKKRWWIF